MMQEGIGGSRISRAAMAVDGVGAEFWGLLRALESAADKDRASYIQGDPNRRLSGMSAALRLNALLRERGCGWGDVVGRDAVLAKLCGRLGSDFAGEQEAAYVLAMRRIDRLGLRWSEIATLPTALLAARPVAAEAAEAPPPGDHHDYVHQPPDGDWPTTIAGLLLHVAWRDDDERLRLDALAAQVDAGGSVTDADAVWLRELWWQAELLVPLQATRVG